MRGLLAICIFAVFFFCYFSTIRWNSCPECNQTIIKTSYRRFGVTEHEERTNISHILFGIGGSSDTWGRRRHYCELWWKPNVTRGFVWLDEDPLKDGDSWPETSPPYKVSADTARFKYTSWYGSRSAVRIARIVKESFALGLENVRWFVMGDDDTVFFTENLVNVLNKYNHTQMYYIGGNSESVEQNMVHSYTTGFGGGGFAISYSLAEELVKILDGCIDRYAEFYGSDRKIAGCMTEIGVPITKELGFHQMDIRGSPFGLLSAHPLSPLVSLHHLDYLHPLFPSRNRIDSIKNLIQAYKMDPTRILQHSICHDMRRKWSVSVSWGYNVQLYPFPVTATELNTPLQTFLTWGSWSRGPFTFNTRSMSMNPCNRPVIFYLDKVELVNSTTLTSYKRSGHEHRRRCVSASFDKAFSLKGFNVSAAPLHHTVFDKKHAPRRQCCEILNGTDQRDGVVQVRLRGCQQWESVSLP